MTIQIDAGDILIKHHDGSGTSWLIQFGQRFSRSTSRGKRKYVHAAIAVSGDSVIEASGSGMAKHSLTQDNAQYTYDIFSCNKPWVPDGAAHLAEMLVGYADAQRQQPNSRKDRIKYTMKGAFRSLFRRKPVKKQDRVNIIVDRFDNGSSEYYFCSGFVVQSYIIAAEQCQIEPQIFFDLDDKSYNPSKLHDHLSKSNCFNSKGTSKGRDIRVA